MLGQYVINKTYQRVKKKFSFNPIDERFEVQNPAILKDKTWLPDISEAINGDLFEIADRYFELNPDVDKKHIRNSFSNLINIPKKQIPP